MVFESTLRDKLKKLSLAPIPVEQVEKRNSGNRATGLCPQELTVAPKKGKAFLYLEDVSTLHCSMAFENRKKAWGMLITCRPLPAALFFRSSPRGGLTPSDQCVGCGDTVLIIDLIGHLGDKCLDLFVEALSVLS